VAEESGDEELWLLKRPIEIRQSGTSPFFEGEVELKICQTLHLFAQQTFTGEERRLGTNLRRRRPTLNLPNNDSPASKN